MMERSLAELETTETQATSKDGLPEAISVSGTITLDVKVDGTRADVHIYKCDSLASADANGLSDPYIKAC